MTRDRDAVPMSPLDDDGKILGRDSLGLDASHPSRDPVVDVFADGIGCEILLPAGSRGSVVRSRAEDPRSRLLAPFDPVAKRDHLFGVELASGESRGDA